MLIFFSSCTAEKEYQYEVDTVSIDQEGSDKSNQKSTDEFIAIAYADLFGTTIPQNKLVNLNTAYTAFGDKKVIEERIVRNFLNDPAVIIPSQPAVGGDTVLFIVQCYEKFYNRTPTEFEKYNWKKLIAGDPNVKPLTIYYAMMTSDEYRFY